MASDLAPRRRTTGILALAVLLVAGVALAPTPALGAPSSTLTRYPYLTDLAGGSVTVNWATTRTSAVTGVGDHRQGRGRAGLRQPHGRRHQDQHHRQVGVPVPVAGDRARPGARRHLLLPRLPGHQPKDRPARVRPLPDVPGRAARAAGRAVQLRRVRRLGPGECGQRQPRPGGPAGPAGQDRRPVRRRHRGHRQPLGQPVQLRRPVPDRQQCQRRLRPQVLGRAREVAAVFPGGRQPHAQQHLPAQLAPAEGRGQLGRPLPDGHLLLSERHQLQGLRQRLVRL